MLHSKVSAAAIEIVLASFIFPPGWE